MAWRFTGHARVDPSSPHAFGRCDRCGFLYNLESLKWQFDWRGNRLANLRILVCDTCLDVPFQHYRPVIVPPDPVPVMNARPEPYAQYYNPNVRVTEDGGTRVTEDDQRRVTQETGDLMLYDMTHPIEPVPTPSPYPEGAYTNEDETAGYVNEDDTAYYVTE